MKKTHIRKSVLKIREKKFYKNINIDFKIILNLLKRQKIKGKIVGGYYPYNNEIDCIKILKKFENKKYKIFLPKIRNNFLMDFFEWNFKEPLMINKYGIPEPISKKRAYPDIILVPLLAFDKNLNRVGYGGGFYDRYIQKTKRKKKFILIGLAYSFQEVKRININKTDMRLDFILTEKNVLK